MIEPIAKYNTLDEPLSIFASTFNKILACDNSVDVLAVFMFYYNTAKWQNNSCPRATVSFVSKGLKISERRVHAARSELKELGLIEDIKRQDKDTGKVVGWFVNVRLSTHAVFHPVAPPHSGDLHPKYPSIEGNTIADKEKYPPPPISPNDQARDGVVYESRQDRWKPSPEMTKNLMSAICDRYGYSQPDMAAFNSILIEKHYQSIPDENIEILCSYLKEFDWKDKEKARYVTHFSPASDFRQNFDKLIAKACSEYEAPLSPELQEMVRKARGW